ncbi:hypothetical protein M0804_013946 [Polistes exclamans]|nr:hypothetical protein M0804_013946 [Polistes exclamans]
MTNKFLFSVKNSFEFLEFIHKITLPEDYRLVSLNAISLFTNIPKKLLIKMINDDWNELKNFIMIQKNILLEIIQFCFESSYFQFDGFFYQQLDGSSMGNPASPILANLVMNNVLIKIEGNLPFTVLFLKVYVVDIITATPKYGIEVVLKTFNMINEIIQIIIEVEDNGTLPFLDVTVIRNEDETILTNWYVKPTSSGKCIKYNSNDPLSQKIGTIKSLLFRALTLSSKNFHIENRKKIETFLKNNNYPKSLIVFNEFKIDKDRVKNPNLQDKKYIKFPYIKSLVSKIIKCFKNTNFKLVFFNLPKINSIYTKLKDKVDKFDQSNLVYKIPCECNKSYIGQTKQKLKKRLDKHKNYCKPINVNKTNTTALAEHHFTTGYNLKFNTANILDLEENWYKRNISEMYHISNNNTRTPYTDDI